jgi:hypothetical protein
MNARTTCRPVPAVRRRAVRHPASILVFCLGAFGVLAVCVTSPVMAVDGDMEGGRWELVGVNGGLAGVFRNGLAEGFPHRPNLLPSGRLTMWHANGTKSGEAEFIRGFPEGKFRGSHENGQLAVEGQIQLCELVTATLWDNRGRRRFVISEDSWTGYDESGGQTSYTIDEVFEITGRNAFFFWLMSSKHGCSKS